jgi:cytochrome c oxidase subunit 4
MSEIVESPKLYLLIFGTLMIMTLVTVGAAFIDFGPFNIIIALSIAIFKAVLVILFFMHVRHRDHLTWIYVSAGFYWLLILIIITMTDFISRGWLH